MLLPLVFAHVQFLQESEDCQEKLILLMLTAAQTRYGFDMLTVTLKTSFDEMIDSAKECSSIASSAEFGSMISYLSETPIFRFPRPPKESVLESTASLLMLMPPSAASGVQ
jgi:hypothetical protein